MSVPIPFLTALDDRAKVKGSRDPLGLQPLWTRLGRKIVRNLTTVTASLREFTVHLLGMEFAQRAARSISHSSAGLDAYFLKWEQLAAYSRCAINGEQQGVRGIERVLFRLANAPVRISADSGDQILSDQRVYGLWGLYSVAARNSGWLEVDRNALTPAAREFVENVYLKALGRSALDRIDGYVAGAKKFDPAGHDRELAKSIAALLGLKLGAAEVEFYQKYLLEAGDGQSPQAQLWRRMRQDHDDQVFSPADLQRLIAGCQDADERDLRRSLKRIQRVEQVIGPARILFDYLLGQNQRTLGDVSREVGQAWPGGFHAVDPGNVRVALEEIECAEETRRRLERLAGAWLGEDYEAAIICLLEHNAAVMRERGGAAWIGLKGGILEVRARLKNPRLPPRQEVERDWRNSYFLDSFKLIGRQIVKGAAHGP